MQTVAAGPRGSLSQLARLPPEVGNFLGEEYLHQRLVGNVAVLRKHLQLLQQAAGQTTRHRSRRTFDVGLELQPNPPALPVDLVRAVMGQPVLGDLSLARALPSPRHG